MPKNYHHHSYGVSGLSFFHSKSRVPVGKNEKLMNSYDITVGGDAAVGKSAAENFDQALTLSLWSPKEVHTTSPECEFTDGMYVCMDGRNGMGWDG